MAYLTNCRNSYWNTYNGIETLSDHSTQYKQGATPIVYAYMYRSLRYRYLNTSTTPSRSTIHLAEEWTGGVDVGWGGVDCVVSSGF
eukprot:1609768-Rhodomonas_salina.1